MSWALVIAGCGGAALGCNDPRRAGAGQAIAREEPAALSLAAESRPGAGTEGGQGQAPAKAAPSPASNAAPAPQDEPREEAGAPEGEVDKGEAGDDAADAKPEGRRRAVSTTQGRRRRSRAEASAPAAGDAAAGEAERAIVGAPLKVTRLVVSRGVSGREPVGAASSFAAADLDRIYAFVDLANEARAASEIHVSFAPPGGGAPVRVKLDVGPERRWRTWALTRKVRAPGSWSVSVSDAGGKVLARTAFKIVP